VRRLKKEWKTRYETRLSASTEEEERNSLEIHSKMRVLELAIPSGEEEDLTSLILPSVNAEGMFMITHYVV
jgi:hypothetical protein